MFCAICLLPKPRSQEPELDPANPHSYINLGAVLGGEGRLDEAMREYEKAVEHDPSQAEAYFNWGLFQFKDSKNKGMQKYHKAALL